MNLPGLCLFYGGMLDSRNVVNTFATCLAVACALTLLWLGVGYSLVYGATGGAILGGLDKAFLSGMGPIAPLAVAGPGVPVPLHAVFQATYATITPCLIIGAYAGRMRFFPSIALCAGWMLAVYCPFARMVWGGGLLEQMGLVDFAGGIVIHITAGFAALVAAMYMRPRRRLPKSHGPPNLVSIMVGTGLIWATWLAFNAGSTPTSAPGMHLAWVFATSMTAASTGGVTWLLTDSCTGSKRPTALGLCLGIVAALVGITPAALFVSLPGAVAIGAITALCCRAAMEWMRATRVDDACEVFGLHGTGGIVGNALTALFAATQLGGSQVIPNLWAQFALHMGAAGAACAWSGAVTWLLLAAMDACIPGGVRVTSAVEDIGLDAGIHGEAATQ